MGVLVAKSIVPDFTIGVVPDPQHEVANYPAVWTSLCNWFSAQKTAQNILAVVCIGDNVDVAETAVHWTRAVAGAAIMEAAAIPYLMVMGNHDYDGGDHGIARDATLFNENFGAAYFAGKAYYRGCYSAANENYYATINSGHAHLLFLLLELFPRPGVVTWASGIIDANPQYQVIIVTHSHLTPEGTQTDDDSDYGIDSYGFPKADYNGQELWAALAYPKSNVIAILSGHDIAPPNTAYRTDANNSGLLVPQTFQNWQLDENGGDGWVGLMRFSHTDKKIYFTYYRTYEPSGLGEDVTKAFNVYWEP